MKYLMQYENFWRKLFPKDEKLSKGDYVRALAWEDVGEIVDVLKVDPKQPKYIVKFNKIGGTGGMVYYPEELKKITRKEFDLDSDINKFNL